MGRELDALEGILARADTEPDGYRCEREGADHRMELWGRLSSDWAGNLGLHLFAAGLQVLAGDAMRARDGTWAASFLLQSARGSAPHGHDFLQMARRAPRHVPPLPAPVISISVRLSHEAPGSVYANVVGKDSSGLIAHVLGHFGRFGLRPRRFVIRTSGDDVDDWFWLDPVTSPSSRVVPVEALEQDWRSASAL